MLPKKLTETSQKDWYTFIHLYTFFLFISLLNNTYLKIFIKNTYFLCTFIPKIIR
jgi:hypothetical protein